MKESAATAFTKAKRMFDAAIRAEYGKAVNADTSYEEWLQIPDDLKAAALFVIFYDKITLVRVKTYLHPLCDADAVSMVCDKLVALTPKIVENARMFSPSFMYTAIKNVLGEPLRRKKYHLVNILDTKAFYSEDDSDPVPYDIRIDTTMMVDNSLTDTIDILMVWDTLTDEQKAMVKALIMKDNRSIGMSRYCQKKVIRDLQKIFADFKSGESAPKKLTFGDVYEKDDFVECADVVMPDGNIAQYYGMTEGDEDHLRIIFIGAYRDYKIALRKAVKLEVTNVDWYE